MLRRAVRCSFAVNVTRLCRYISGGNALCAAVTQTGGLSTNQLYVVNLAARWTPGISGWTAAASLNGRTGSWAPGGTLAAAPTGQGGGAPPAAAAASFVQSGTSGNPQGPWSRRVLCETSLLL